MESRLFGVLPSGEKITAFTLGNGSGFSMEVLTYGATVSSLRAPDRRGKLDDVVLGFSRLEDYIAPHPYFGAIVGRVAGGISRARFEVDGDTYKLPVNDPPNHLHGGQVGFSRRVWLADQLVRTDNLDSLQLVYCSPDGEEGYPGCVTAKVTYTVTTENAVVVEMEATTDRATPISLTQHSYFNLAGEGSSSIEGHELQIIASDFAPTDKKMTLLGIRESVIGKSNDFNQSRRLGDVLPLLFQGHGDLYFLNQDGLFPSVPSPRKAACVFEPGSGRVLSVSTTEDCLQFYTGVFLDEILIGKSERPYGKHAGLCLECEGYPDGANVPALGDIVLRAGQVFRQTTIYAFSTN